MINNRPVVVRGPLWDVSGYGAFTRYIVRAMFLVGMAPRVPKIKADFFSRYKPSSEEEERFLEGVMLPPLTTKEILDSIVINVQPATIANRCYRYNILYTMIETDRISPWWAECCNEMDSTWVPGPFNKESFETSGVRHARIVTPGFDTDVYRVMKEGECSKNVWDRLENAPDLNFIIMGALCHSNQDRKGIKQLIRCFARTFEGDPGVGIILKTQLVNHTPFDQMGLMSEIGDLLKKEGRPNAIKNITVIHENYTSAEMASLYNHPKIKCFVTSTMGEGCGQCLLESSACGLPIMATNWSEHINLLAPEGFIPLPCEVRQVPDEYADRSDMVYLKDARWAHIDDGVLRDALVDFVDHPMERKAMDYSHLSLKSFGKRIREAIGDDLRVKRLGKSKPKKVQVASGIYPTRGYFHVDIDPINTAQLDLVADAKNLTIDPDSVDEVLIVHLLEHLRDWEIYRVLFEAWKVLRPGGMVEVHVPDFDVAARMFKERGRSLSLLTRAIKTMLGTNNSHINLFDLERLKDFLESVGFHDVRTLEMADVYDEIAELSLERPTRVSLCVSALKGRLPGRE